jgi:transcriptional regulator with XRE-family HTH domain
MRGSASNPLGFAGALGLLISRAPHLFLSDGSAEGAMTTENHRPSPVRAFPKRAKKGSHPYLSFGSALALMRKRTGKKQAEIAQQASLTKGMLSSYETGRQRPSLESLTKILEVLGADFHDLQDALDLLANRPLRASGGSLRQRELGEQERDREHRIGRAVLDVATSFAEAMRDSSAPELRIVGSIGDSRLRAGER